MVRRRRPVSSPRRHPRIRKGDKVVVITGADKSAEAREVLHVYPETGKVLVKDVNMRWHHERRSQQNPKGGRIQKEAPIDLSNVLLFSETARKGVRLRIRIEEHENAAGEKKKRRVRVGTCGTRFDRD
jgi:large subunit ribosomal protein L24